MSENYWRDMYGPQSPDFIRGVIAGVVTFAVWKDGRPVVGVMQKSLTQAIKEIKEGLGADNVEPKP